MSFKSYLRSVTFLPRASRALAQQLPKHSRAALDAALVAQNVVAAEAVWLSIHTHFGQHASEKIIREVSSKLMKADINHLPQPQPEHAFSAS
jgi:hypothetical protein